jgi:hypothetical protein
MDLDLVHLLTDRREEAEVDHALRAEVADADGSRLSFLIEAL